MKIIKLIKFLSKFSIFFLTIILLIKCTSNKSDGLNYNFFESNKWGTINKDGIVILENEFKGDISMFNNGYIIQKKDKNKTYFINTKGIESTNSYKELTYFNNGYAFAVNENTRPFSIDDNGKEGKEIEVEEIHGFVNGMASIKSEGLYGFLNNDLKISIKPKYSFVTYFSDEGYAIVEEGETVKILKKNGKEITLPKNENIYFHFKDGYLLYLNEERLIGIMDIDGDIIVRPNSDWGYLTNFREGLASYEEDGLWGAIDKEGVKVIRAKYNHPLIFNDGLAAAFIKKDGKIKVGFVDKAGKYVIEPSYDWATLFINGKSLVKEGKYFYFIDQKNQKSKEEYKHLSIDKLMLYLRENNYNDYIKFFTNSLPNEISISRTSFSKVNNDFYDVQQKISEIVTELKINTNTILNGIEKNTKVNSDVLKELNISTKDPSEISEYDFRHKNTNSLSVIKEISNEFNFGIKIKFTDNIYTKKTNKVESFDYYSRKYIEKEIFSHVEFNDSLKIKDVFIQINTFGKAKSKENFLIDEIKNHFETNYNIVEVPYVQDSGSEKYFKISDEIYAKFISYRNNPNLILIDFHFIVNIPKVEIEEIQVEYQ